MDLIMREPPSAPGPAVAPPPQAILCAETDLAEVVLHPFLGSQVAVFSARAPGKASVNEDALALIHAGPQSGVLVVADGLGGPPAGEQASRLAVQILAETVRDAAVRGRPLREAILSGIDLANASILARANGAGTTLAVVEIHEGVIRSYHVGDSMILVTGQRGKIKLQSIAHSPVGYAVEAGLLDVDEAVHHEGRNLVSNVLGSPDMRIEMGPQLRLAPRDTLLLASDGLADNLYLDEIVEGIRRGPLKQATTTLIRRCLGRMTGASAGASDQQIPPDGSPPRESALLPTGQGEAPAEGESGVITHGLDFASSGEGTGEPSAPSERPNNPDDLTLVAFRLPSPGRRPRPPSPGL